MTENNVPFTVDEQGLELLHNAETYALLETFEEPLNPSAAAKKLGVPANRLHYHVKRLSEAGLLRVVSERGRSRVYQRVSTKFRFRKEALGVVAEAVTAGAGDLLEGLQKGFTRALETFFGAAQREADEDTDEYGLLDLGEGVPHAYQPMLGMAEVRLSREGYASVVRVMREALTTAEKEADEGAGEGDVCTVAVVVYPGRAVSEGRGGG